MRERLKQIPLLKMTVSDPEFMQGAPTQAPRMKRSGKLHVSLPAGDVPMARS